MGLFDALRGRPREDASSSASSSLSAPAELLEGERGGGDASTSSSSAAGSAHSVGIELPTGERLYNPYEGLAAAVDGRGMRGQYRLPAQVRRRCRRASERAKRPADFDDAMMRRKKRRKNFQTLSLRLRFVFGVAMLI